MTSDSLHPDRRRFLPLAVGSIGVVFGDIGTSPLYALHEAIGQAAAGGLTHDEVLGVISLALWALILVVTIKYVLFLMRADNNGEGGVLSLMALAQRAVGRRTKAIFILGLCGAALFYGDAVITPSISVLSAVEGLRSVPALASRVTEAVVLEITLAILVGLFLVQSRGTGKVATWFGPICLFWFFAIAVLGAMALVRVPAILLAFSPTYAVVFLAQHGVAGLLVLGSVFLTVTGAEALYADMGHFGRWPIQASWLYLVLPALALNYLGQGALVMETLARTHGQTFQNLDWFFLLCPQALRIPMVALAAIATVIASQAVITGAFSLSHQAMQLGLLPRMQIQQTSESHAGQIYLPQVNLLLLIGVIMLVAIFKTSSNLAQAYGLAVTGTMVVTTSLAFIVVRRLWGWSLLKTLALVAPLLTIDLVFLGANALKVLSGGWVPLLLGSALMGVMATWVRGARIVSEKTRKESVPLDAFVARISARPPDRVSGTAIYLSADPEVTPGALLHNLKHNSVLHERNIILTVRATQRPRVSDDQRCVIEPLTKDFIRIGLNYGFMERPDLPRALELCRKQGLAFNLMDTSFFLGRRTVVQATKSPMPKLQERLFIFLTRNASSPTDFFQIPPGRVVEMGTQTSV